MSVPQIDGQLNEAERQLLTEAIIQASEKPKVVIEVGTWLGGGSTLHILRALERNGTGHLWGIEADETIYERMVTNIRAAAPEACQRFTPLFGFSQKVIPRWLQEQGQGVKVDFVFLDGAPRPSEQVVEFRLLDRFIPVGGQLMAHDANIRKGRWLVPYLSRLDHWQVRVINASEFGLLHARKIAQRPSPASRRAATAKLLLLRCNPVEVIGAVLPASVCAWILARLPKRLVNRLAHGIK
jgi:predicted O-methyltransferase YrrM